MVSFAGVCLLLTYIKYYTRDHDTAVLHLGFVASGFTIAVYGSPLVSVVRILTPYARNVQLLAAILVSRVLNLSRAWGLGCGLGGAMSAISPDGHPLYSYKTKMAAH